MVAALALLLEDAGCSAFFTASEITPLLRLLYSSIITQDSNDGVEFDGETLSLSHTNFEDVLRKAMGGALRRLRQRYCQLDTWFEVAQCVRKVCLFRLSINN